MTDSTDEARPRQTLDTTIAVSDRVRPYDEVRDHRLAYDSDRRGTVLEVADGGQSVLVQWDDRSASSWNGGIGLVKVQPDLAAALNQIAAMVRVSPESGEPGTIVEAVQREIEVSRSSMLDLGGHLDDIARLVGLDPQSCDPEDIVNRVRARCAGTQSATTRKA